MNKLLALLFGLGFVITPATAKAHAHLTRSAPAAGSHLSSPPSVIRLWFSERPELSMTLAELKDASGKQYPLGSASSGAANKMEVDLPVTMVLPPGSYTLTWRTSALDGHPSHGTFSFSLASAPGNGTSDTSKAASDTAASAESLRTAHTTAENGPDVGSESEEMNPSASPANALARALSFAGILAMIGAVTFIAVIIRRTVGLSEGVKSRLTKGSAFVGLVAGALIIVAALVRLYLELRMMRAMPDMHQMTGLTYSDMVMRTTWGLALRLQVASALVVAIALWFTMRGRRFSLYVALVAALLLAITPALSGHAAATTRFTSMMILGDWLHVLGGSGWLGSLLMIVVIGIPTTWALQGQGRWDGIASLVNAFYRLPSYLPPL